MFGVVEVEVVVADPDLSGTYDSHCSSLRWSVQPVRGLINHAQSTELGVVVTYRVFHAVQDAVDFPTTQSNARPICIFDVVVDDGAAATPAADPW